MPTTARHPADARDGRDGASGSVAGAQEAVAAEARQGRPSGGTGSTAEPGALAAAGPGTGSAQSFVDDLTGDPRSVSGRSAQDIADLFNAAGYPATVEQSRKKGTSGNAVQVRIQGHPEITNIQVAPGRRPAHARGIAILEDLDEYGRQDLGHPPRLPGR